jgi:glycosyltransferase involved in cell wall biosynthesis
MVVDTLGIPLAVHVSDDWICDWPVNGLHRRNVFPIAQLLNRWCKLEFVKAIRSARLRFCISQAMSIEYERRYGYAFSRLHNGIDPQQWPAKEIKPVRDGEPFRILYSGSVTENGNLHSLMEVADAVAALGARGVQIRLEIATHTSGFTFRGILERSPWVKFTELVPYADLPRRLQEFDLLLIALNFDTVSSRWLRYSMLGKVAEYMISGTPVLLYGPPDTTSVEYAICENWGHAVTTPGRESIEAALIQLISDVGLRRRLASTARQVALRDQDITRMRHDFQIAVCRAALS